MPEKTLFLEIFQPFAQYRNPFTFYYAQTYPLPPKSTIIGMLQNAVGDWYGSELGVDNWWRLKISIHGGFESIFWNYQQLIKGEIELREIIKTQENGNTFRIIKLFNQNLPLYGQGLTSQRTPIYQQELFNGHLYIFIRAKEERQIKLLEKIKEALEKPKKILYLGRSEDVIFIKKVEEVDNDTIKLENVKKSLWLTFPTYIRLEDFPIINQKFPVYSIPVEVKFKNKKENDKYEYVKHKTEITKQTEREVKFETIIYSTSENPIYLDSRENSIKVEKIIIGENKIFKIPKEWGWL